MPAENVCDRGDGVAKSSHMVATSRIIPPKPGWTPARRRAGGHNEAGHKRVTDSCTFIAYEPPRSVKRLSGWAAAAGTAFGSVGIRPLRIAGTAASVYGATVVSLRYHVAAPERAAKFGKRPASTWPVPSSRDSNGNSSSTIITIRCGRAGVAWRRLGSAE